MKRGLLTTAVAAIAASICTTSCIINDKTLGGGLVPEDLDYKIHLRTVPVEIHSRIPDSMQANYLSSIVFGDIVTDEGYTSVGCCTDIVPSTNASVISGNPQAKEFYIILKKDNSKESYCDRSFAYNPQEINVFRMNEYIDYSETGIYNTTVKEDMIGTEPVNERTLYFGEDELKINMSLDFANEILRAGKSELDTTANFEKKFKGLFFRTSPAEQGGRMNYFLHQAEAYIRFSFERDGALKDSTIMLTVGSRNPFGKGTYASASIHDTDKGLVSEGLLGTKPVIEANEIKRIFDQIAKEENVSTDRIVLSKASVYLPFELAEDTDYETLDMLPKQFFATYRTTSISDNFYAVYYDIHSEINTSVANLGKIDRQNFCYRFDLTFAISDLKDKNEDAVDKSDDLWIMPIVNLESSSSSSTLPYIHNNLYYMMKFNGTGSSNPPALELAYIILPETE